MDGGSPTKPDGTKGAAPNTGRIGKSSHENSWGAPRPSATNRPDPTIKGTKFLEISGDATQPEGFMEQRVTGGGIRFIAELAVDAAMVDEQESLQREF